MHRLLPAQRVITFAPWSHDAQASGRCRTPQPATAKGARSIPPESRRPSVGLGHSRESSRSRGDGVFRSTPEGVVKTVSAAAAIAARQGVRLFALGTIRFYQACLSPLLPSTCRYYPSCSMYAFEAIEKWGVWTGGRLALRRLLRCRPWGSYGYDPVPARQGVVDESQ
jgi:uncharacterized protein